MYFDNGAEDTHVSKDVCDSHKKDDLRSGFAAAVTNIGTQNFHKTAHQLS